MRMTISMLRITLISLSSMALLACGGETSDAPAPAPAPAAETSQNTRTTVETPDLSPVERGAVLFKRCRACHTLADGDRHKVGPNLWGMFGQTAGAKEGFNYSKAMAASEIVWTDETVSAYIEKPSAYIPGNRMSYVGLRNQEDRDALIAYLREQTGG